MEIQKTSFNSSISVKYPLLNKLKSTSQEQDPQQEDIYYTTFHNLREITNSSRELVLKNNRQLISIISSLICDSDAINSDILEHIISYCSNPNYSLKERVKLKTFLSTEIDICTNIYKQYKKARITISKQTLIKFRQCIFEDSDILRKNNMLYNHAEHNSDMNDVFAMKFVDRDALKRKGCNAFEGTEGAEFGTENTKLYPNSEHYINGVKDGYNFLKEQMIDNDTITFASIMKLALIIHQSTYPEIKLEDSIKLLNISSSHGIDNPYSFLEKEYLSPVPYSVKPLNLYKLYLTLKEYKISLFSNSEVSKIGMNSLSTKFEDIEQISELYTQIWIEFQDQIKYAKTDQEKIFSIIMFGAKFEISHFFKNHNNRMMAIIINLLLEKYCEVSANFYHVNGFSHITMLTVLDNIKDRLPDSTTGRYNFQHLLQEITDGIYWFLINVEMSQ